MHRQPAPTIHLITLFPPLPSLPSPSSPILLLIFPITALPHVSQTTPPSVDNTCSNPSPPPQG